LLRALQRDHVAFLGPRRTGKTSILLDLVNNPPDDITAIKLDLQGLRSVPAWLNLMLAETKRVLELPPGKIGWLRTAGGNVGSILNRVEQITVLGQGIKLSSGQPAVDSWQPVADQFLELLTEHQLPIYFLLDEFPWFLGHVASNHTAADVDAALSWFRKVRQELTDLPARFLVTGSIGLKSLLRRLNLHPAANDFDTIEIEPLTETEALAFLQELADGENIVVTEDARRRMLARIGVGWPILLATFLAEIQDYDSDDELSLDDIDDIYENQLVRGSRNRYCDEMFLRLTKPELFSSSERRLAQEILRDLCRATAGFGRDELTEIHARLVPDAAHRNLLTSELDVVIETLAHDGYLHRFKDSDSQGDGRLVFASHILRDYWRHRTV
jgi:AAA+ ATPase superfamily predicted ATPase